MSANDDDLIPITPSPMKRKRKNGETACSRAEREFEPSGIDTESIVRCKHCKGEFDSKYKCNLVNHLKNCHKKIYEQNVDLEQHQAIVARKRLKLLQNVTEMVSVNGHPFNSILDSGFQKIIEPELHEFADAGCPLNLTNPHLDEVKEYKRTK